MVKLEILRRFAGRNPGTLQPTGRLLAHPRRGPRRAPSEVFIPLFCVRFRAARHGGNGSLLEITESQSVAEDMEARRTEKYGLVLGDSPEEPKSGLDAALADLMDDHRSGRQLLYVFSLQQTMKIFAPAALAGLILSSF